MTKPTDAAAGDKARIAVLKAVRAALAAGLTEIEIQALVNQALPGGGSG